MDSSRNLKYRSSYLPPFLFPWLSPAPLLLCTRVLISKVSPTLPGTSSFTWVQTRPKFHNPKFHKLQQQLSCNCPISFKLLTHLSFQLTLSVEHLHIYQQSSPTDRENRTAENFGSSTNAIVRPRRWDWKFPETILLPLNCVCLYSCYFVGQLSKKGDLCCTSLTDCQSLVSMHGHQHSYIRNFIHCLWVRGGLQYFVMYFKLTSALCAAASASYIHAEKNMKELYYFFSLGQ